MTGSKTRLAVYTTTTRVEIIITIWPNSEDKRPTKACMRGRGRVDDRHRRQAALPEPGRQVKQHGGAEGRKKENKPSWVRLTRGQQRRDRPAPQRPVPAAADDEDASDDGGGGSMRGDVARRIATGGRVVYLRSMACHKFNLHILGKIASRPQDRPFHRQQ